MGRGAISLTALLGLPGVDHAGTTRCWIDQGAVVVAASFGDIAGDFILDTAAPISQLHVTRANSDGIDGDGATRPLVLAGHRVANVRMAISDLDALPQKDTSIAGIIGMDVLAPYPVTIAFAPCRVTWGAAPWPRGARRVAVVMQGVIPTIEAEVSDGASVRREPMIVATGRTETLVPRATLSRPLDPGSFAPVRLRAVVVVGALLETVPAGLADSVTGSIGTGVWRDWKAMRLDVGRRSLELLP